MKVACDSRQWLPSIQHSRTCFAIDCDNNIIINNNISHAGNKLCAKVDLWRWKAKLQLSVFFQAECEWEPDNQKSNWAKGGLEEGRGWLQWLDQEPLCSTKWGLQTLRSTFPKDCQSMQSGGRLGGKKPRSIAGRIAFPAAFLSSHR